MPIGKPTKVLVQARGLKRAEASITDRDTGAQSTHEGTGLASPNVTFDKPHAMVTVEHGTTMSVNYQTVVSKASVSLPVEATEQGITEGFQRAWAQVEQELADRASWAKEVLETLSDSRNSIEGKR